MFNLVPTKNTQWIASLYFFQSLPYVVVTLIATLMYQQYGMSNTATALLTSLFMIPWTIKPIFAPFLEHLATKRKLTLCSQGALTVLFFFLAFCADPFSLFFSSLIFAVLALISSLHDIVSDGIYLLHLNNEEQKRYVALRSFFYQMGRLIIKGGLLAFISSLAVHYHINVWRFFFLSLFILGLGLTLFHQSRLPEKKIQIESSKLNYAHVFKTIVLNTKTYPILFFIFLYNISEAQMQKVVPLFLLDKEGLGLNLTQVGQLYGVLGGMFLMLGIFISGWLITRYALEKCLKIITILLLLGHLLYLLFPYAPASSALLYFVVLSNQFTVGLANGSYMGYLLKIANKSEYPMSMYTICTSAMALSYVIFGALSGWIEQKFGYSNYFLFIFILNTPLVLMTCKMMNSYD
ncbi:beta lactamase induction signal transducer AmpG [Legionella wadsworthii]|uniref:Beta lactamase induction signal transducer AmpG n=1 Tax=Legionella wadsworthii TaxID=28088 RepID=A0A378LVQ4_9GAMM|nr:MFS transporter [Legionella wadsworthii]STY29888.1 beta lactamase induction signal transducer AmpG [Legionella wadsworthii]